MRGTCGADDRRLDESRPAVLSGCGIAQPGRLQRRDSGTGACSPDVSASSSKTGGTDGGWAGCSRGDAVVGLSRGDSSRRFSLIVSTDEVWLRLKLCGRDCATGVGASRLLGIE